MRRRTCAGVTRPGIVQAGLGIETGQFQQRGVDRRHSHSAIVDVAGHISGKPHGIHSPTHAAGRGVVTRLQVLVAVGIRHVLAGVAGSQALDAGLFQREPFTCIHGAIAIGVLYMRRLATNDVRKCSGY